MIRDNNNHDSWSFEYSIDIRGTFPENLSFGMCSYLPSRKTKIPKELEKEVPFLKRKRSKAAALSPSELWKIAKVLDKLGVHMTVLQISSEELWQLKNTYINEHKYREKIIGAAYMTLVAKKCHKFQHHSVVVDEDNWMDFHYAIRVAKKIAKANKYEISFNTTRSIYNDFIRISDYVAAMVDKVGMEKLQKLPKFEKLSSKINKRFLKKAFKK